MTMFNNRKKIIFRQTKNLTHPRVNKREFQNENKISFRFDKRNTPWLIFGSFIFLQVFITIQTATSGATLVNLERERLELEEKNRYLSEEMVRASSLFQSREKAEELGFAEPQRTLYIKGDVFVAKLP